MKYAHHIWQRPKRPRRGWHYELIAYGEDDATVRKGAWSYCCCAVEVAQARIDAQKAADPELRAFTWSPKEFYDEVEFDARLIGGKVIYRAFVLVDNG